MRIEADVSAKQPACLHCQRAGLVQSLPCAAPSVKGNLCATARISGAGPSPNPARRDAEIRCENRSGRQIRSRVLRRSEPPNKQAGRSARRTSSRAWSLSSAVPLRDVRRDASPLPRGMINRSSFGGHSMSLSPDSDPCRLFGQSFARRAPASVRLVSRTVWRLAVSWHYSS